MAKKQKRQPSEYWYLDKLTGEMKWNLPAKYVPHQLRTIADERRCLTFGCGYHGGEPISFIIYAGPFEDLNEALETVPKENGHKAYIIRFNEDGTDDPIYRWKENAWVLITEWLK